VKLRGGMERGHTALICELVASRLASYFNLLVPEPALVSVDPDFADIVSDTYPNRTAQIRNSVGLNFGSRQLADVATWAIDRAIPEAMWQSATLIFAFDALIQNPDRRFNNPNLFSRGDTLLVYDHELAFSFLEDVLPQPAPWMLGNLRFLNDHVFFKRLKAKELDLVGFSSLLAALPDMALPSIMADVPPEWNNGNVAKIERHLRTVGEHATDFAEEIRRRLA
jgi:hypothetical protein